MSWPIQETIIRWMTSTVLFELGLVLFMAVGVVVMLVYRRWREERLKVLTAVKIDNIVAELLGLMEEKPIQVLSPSSKWVFLEAQATRDAILNQIHAVSGSERDYLVGRYIELGFALQDISGTTSRYWSKRLASAARLAQLSNPVFSDTFNHLIADSNRLVSATALLALSSTHSVANKPNLDRLTDLISDGRLSLFRAILHNWCRIHSFEMVLGQVVGYKSGELRNKALSTLLASKSVESGQALLSLLQDKTIPAELIADLLGALREISEPTAIEVARDFFDHPDHRVKQRAAEIMLALDAPGFDRDLERIKSDSDAGVRRLLQEWQLKRSAG